MVELFVGVTPYGNGAIDYSATPRKLHLGESGANLTFEKKSNIFKDLKDVGTTRSFTFDIPRCQENEEAFLQWEEVPSDSFLWYSWRQLYSCWLYENGVEVFAGVLVIQEATPSVYKCNIIEFSSAWQNFKAANQKLGDIFTDGDFFYFQTPPSGFTGVYTFPITDQKNVIDNEVVYSQNAEGVIPLRRVIDAIEVSNLLHIKFDTIDDAYFDYLLATQKMAAADNKVKKGRKSGLLKFMVDVLAVKGNFYELTKIVGYDETQSDVVIREEITGNLGEFAEIMKPQRIYYPNIPVYGGYGILIDNNAVKAKITIYTTLPELWYYTDGYYVKIANLDANGVGSFEWDYTPPMTSDPTIHQHACLVNLFFLASSNVPVTLDDYVEIIDFVLIGDVMPTMSAKLYFRDMFPKLQTIDVLNEIAKRYGMYGYLNGDEIVLYQLNKVAQRVLNYDFADWTERLQDVKTMKRNRTGLALLNDYIPAGDAEERYNEHLDYYYGEISTNFWQNFTNEKTEFQSKFGTAENNRWAKFEVEDGELKQTDDTPLIWNCHMQPAANSFSWGYLEDITHDTPDEWYYFQQTHETEQNILANYVELKVSVYMTAEEYRTLDITRPIYLQQYNSFCIIESIRRTAGKHTAEVVLIRLNIYEQRPEPEPDEGEGGSSDLPPDEPMQ